MHFHSQFHFLGVDVECNKVDMAARVKNGFSLISLYIKPVLLGEGDPCSTETNDEEQLFVV